jgi:hypothetical protein
MKLNYLILFGVLFSIEVLIAQTNFRPGYIIKHTGDTIYGNIDYRADFLMSGLCKFKDKENLIKEYSPYDITAFRFIDSKYYVSREISGRRLFLEYLIKGEVNIYYNRDENGDHYYLDKEDIRLTEIPYEEGIKYVNDKKVFYETTRHIGLLRVYMQDAPELQSQINSVKYLTHRNLIKLAEDYHNIICEEEQCVIFEKQLPLVNISITPFVGLTKYIGYEDFAKEYGGDVYFWMPRLSENLFFRTGLSYHKIIKEGEELKTYKIPIQFQYIYRAYKIQPKIGGGFNILSLKKIDYKHRVQSLSLNAGFNYVIYNGISLSTAFNTDFTPFSRVISNEDLKFELISYSFIIGLRIDI